MSLGVVEDCYGEGGQIQLTTDFFSTTLKMRSAFNDVTYLNQK